MEIILLKSKLHLAKVTHSEIEYDGSFAIDVDLLTQADIAVYEQIHIYNVDNGERFITYAIEAEAGSGVISANGAAAHKASPGDRVIICSYCRINKNETVHHTPKLVYLDASNKIIRTTTNIPLQLMS